MQLTLGHYYNGGEAHDLTVPLYHTLILKDPKTLHRLFVEHIGQKVFFGKAEHVVPFMPTTASAVLFELHEDRPMGFNPLDGQRSPQTVSGAFNAVYPSNVATVQLDRYLIPACLALSEIGGTLFQLPYLYTSPTFRARVMGMVKDPVIKEALERFDARKPQDQDDQTNSLQNRFLPLITDPLIRSTIFQKKLFEQPDILIVDMPHGDRYDFLAAMILAQCKGVSFIERPLLHLGDTTPVIACDYLDQLPEPLLKTLLGTATIMATRLGAKDTKTLTDVFGVDPNNPHLHELLDGRALVKAETTTMIYTHHLTHQKPSNIRHLRARSKQWYGTPIETINRKLESYMRNL